MAEKENALLRFLYQTAPGRALLKVVSARGTSALCGRFLDSPLSKPLIRRFVRKNGIDLSEYEPCKFRCFNDCFCRKIRPELRPIAENPAFLIAPCDGLLSAYPVTDGTVFPIKHTRYSVRRLLKNDALADRYRDGYCFVLRLCVSHYHRYAYACSGEKSENVYLPGRLHTVRPIASESYEVFIENCREYTTISTERFGLVTQMEVGALLVGKILNFDGACTVRRGTEKGTFAYGGSTVLLFVEKGAIERPTAYLAATAQGEETPVRLGEAIARGKK